MKIYLGGDEDIDWRRYVMAECEQHDVDFYNPLLEIANPNVLDKNERQKEICDYCLYVLTNSIHSAYTTYELLMQSLIRPKKIIVCFLLTGDTQVRAIHSVENLEDKLESRKIRCFDDLDEVMWFFIQMANDKRALVLK